MKHKRMFVFIDLEMTGLDYHNDVILEAAMIITDTECNRMHPGISYVVSQPTSELAKMDDWCTKTHTKSGLVDAVQKSTYSVSFVQQEFIKIIQQYAPNQSGILAGNSIWQDRLFLARLMPDMLSFLHYRILDVSSIKELFNAWKKADKKEFVKEETHRALDDIEETIEELKFYKKNMF
jgi:oligoribonuclease